MKKFETYIDTSLRRTILSRKISNLQNCILQFQILSSKTLRKMILKFGEKHTLEVPLD
jgi:hypothetical protein